MTTSSDAYQNIIKMSFAYFSDTHCTPDTLEQYIKIMQSLLDECGETKEDVYAHLERLHNISILDSSAILEDHGDHIEWFNPSLNNGLDRDIEWHFWSHYKDYLSAGKNWPKGIVDSIDSETSSILSRLEDPLREGQWDRRGMVMGSVQSGKTANYTGLITKSIDAGYKLIVVLAGTHNSLRSQTQFRLNEEILGYDLDKVQEFRGQAARIGVRAMFQDHAIVQTLTSSSESGDFKKRDAEKTAMIPDLNGPAIIMIVKKHVSILKYLIDWATSIIGIDDDSGRRVVTDIPLLVIDDECDYASVNTKKTVKDENGLIVEDCDPARTNLRIRELLTAFYKSVYIGYTATPFANIFIHHEDKHPLYGEDLFPRNFIYSLSQPTNYIGPERMFGLLDNPAVGIKGQEPLPLLRSITDSETIIPNKHKKDLIIGELPQSLKNAIKDYLISCAVRRMRNSSPPHNSMLIHVTRFTAVQSQVEELVTKELRRNINRIQNSNDRLEDFKEIWETGFMPVSEVMNSEFGCPIHTWQEVMEHLYPVARKIRTKTVNGTVKDSLDYKYAEMETKRKIELGETVLWEDRGQHYIAIGGDKLSRGLTLDGLTVSYYLRASRMYDTLMQMGRWFGYRDGYEDTCRIYTTNELIGWYRFIATASVELRHELEYMALINEEPKNFGLKVCSHPGQLAVTSAGKRRNAEILDLSYSGRISETVVFDLSHSERNLEALNELSSSISRDGKPFNKTRSGALQWTDVPPEVVITYLNKYKTLGAAARVVNPRIIAKFIEEQQHLGDQDLVTWHVAIISRHVKPPHILHLNGTDIGCIERSPLSLMDNELTIGRLLSPSDEWIDFSEQEKLKAREKWVELRELKGMERPEPNKLPSGPAIRAARPKQRGLLLVYSICNDKSEDRYGMEAGQEVTGFGVSFPGSKTTRQVTYEVNTVYQDAED